MPLRMSNTSLLAKIETTEGTDSAPTNEYVEIYNPSLAYVDETEQKAPMLSGMSKGKTIFNRRHATLSFGVDVKGQGAAGSEPDWGPLIEACGFSKTVASGTSVTYTVTSGETKSITLYKLEDGQRHKLVGCRGTVSFSFGNSATAMADFSFIGVPAEDSPDAFTFPFTATVDGTVPVSARAGSFTFGGVSFDIATGTIDVANQVELTDNYNTASGYGPTVIVDRVPVGTFDPFQEIGSNNILALLKANDEHAVAWTNGGTSGNIVEINCPKATISSAGEGERAGLKTYATDFTIGRDSGDDDVSIVVR